MAKLARCVEGHVFDSALHAACPKCGWVVPTGVSAIAEIAGNDGAASETAPALNRLVAFGGGACVAAIVVAAVIWMFYPRPPPAHGPGWTDRPPAHADQVTPATADQASKPAGVAGTTRGTDAPSLDPGAAPKLQIAGPPVQPPPNDAQQQSSHHESRQQQADASPTPQLNPAPGAAPNPAPQQAAPSQLTIPASAISSGGTEWGAISISPSTNAWGDSYSYGNRSQAERRAAKECSAYAQDCVVALSYYRQCGAVATRDGNNWATGLGSTVEQSARDALGACGRGGHSDCQILAVSCTQ